MSAQTRGRYSEADRNKIVVTLRKALRRLGHGPKQKSVQWSSRSSSYYQLALA